MLKSTLSSTFRLEDITLGHIGALIAATSVALTFGSLRSALLVPDSTYVSGAPLLDLVCWILCQRRQAQVEISSFALPQVNSIENRRFVRAAGKITSGAGINKLPNIPWEFSLAPPRYAGFLERLPEHKLDCASKSLLLSAPHRSICRSTFLCDPSVCQAVLELLYLLILFLKVPSWHRIK